MNTRNARALLGGAALLALCAAPAPAAAQEATVYATGSVDGNETGIGLLGLSVRRGGVGLQPIGVLQVYHLRYRVAAEVEDEDDPLGVWGVQPQVGLAYYGTGGAVEARVGYNFQTDPDDGVDDDVVLEGEAGGRGVTTTLQAQSWAMRPELLGIATYNWEAKYLWSQAQAVLPVGPVGVGAELVWQQQLGDDDGDGFDYRSTSVGPVVRFGLGRESALVLGGGYKDDNVRDPTWYARFTVVGWGIRF